MNGSGSNNNNNTARQFTRILGGDMMDCSEDFCMVAVSRNLQAEIMGRPVVDHHALGAMFSYQSMDDQGRTLNLGETALLQREVNVWISALRDGGILVTAVHNHWLFDRPRLMYVHCESVEPPLDFARKISAALQAVAAVREEEEN